VDNERFPGFRKAGGSRAWPASACKKRIHHQGLAIAHSTVKERHGGELSFQIQVPGGTTFSIRLPIGASA
jgi:sensor histidine kinase regulating citrate/malate metabolism